MSKIKIILGYALGIALLLLWLAWSYNPLKIGL